MSRDIRFGIPVTDGGNFVMMNSRVLSFLISLFIWFALLPAQSATAQGGEEESMPQRSELPYGVGAQWAAPAYGVSGMYDFSEEVSGQVVLGFFGPVSAFSGRILYRFQKSDAYDLYGYGTVGSWNYSRGGSSVGFGAGAGLEYSWPKLLDNSEAPPLFGNIEVGFVTLSNEFEGYNFSSFVYGVGIHYRFGD